MHSPFRQTQQLVPPEAQRIREKRLIGKQTIEDDYAWLKAENWQDVLRDPSLLPEPIKAYLMQENAYTQAAFAGSADLQANIKAEMRGRLKEDDSSVPFRDGVFAYANRHRAGGQYPILFRTPVAGGEEQISEQILLDGDKEAERKPFFSLGCGKHSPDHALFAWSCDIKGSEYFDIRVRDLASGEDMTDIVPNSSGDLVWSADSRSFYYVEMDENHRPLKVRRHDLGDDPVNDALIYEEEDPGFFVGINRSQSGRFLFISAHDHETTDIRLLDLESESPVLRPVAGRIPHLQYEIEHHGDHLIILTNADEAEDFKIVTAPLDQPERVNWQDLVPHEAGTMILDQIVLKRFLIRLERRDANPRIVVRSLTDHSERTITFDEEAYSLGIEAGYEFDTDIVRFRYSSLSTPAEIYDYDLVNNQRTLRKRQEVPSGHNPADYRVRRLYATAPDGEKVPISLLTRRDAPVSGARACLLYGYGAYGISIPAGFHTNVLSLVDRGFAYAIAHTRGGTEKGWNWYQRGKLAQKPNTFTDFIACAEALIAHGVTGKGRIVAHGGSAGGMLMGAVANLAPDLFAGIAAEVPFVDVLNTMLDSDLPLTPPEWPEWGNPAADSQAFETIAAYSPYDNVRAQRYPAILALGGLADSRVTYWEPAKWVARLRSTMTGGGPIFLRINMDAGHGGASGRFDRLDEVALVYDFALQACGYEATI